MHTKQDQFRIETNPCAHAEAPAPTPVTVHRQPAKSPSWALESFASSLMFPLTTKFSWNIRIRTTLVRLHHECAGWVTYFDVRMAPAAESVGSVALPRRSKRRR